MKKTAPLLIALFVLVNVGFAQHIFPRQEVVTNNRTAKFTLAENQNNFFSPLMQLKNKQRHLKSTPTVKLDSIVISTRSSESEPWVKVNSQVFSYNKYLQLAEITSTAGLYSYSNWPQKAVFSYNSVGQVESIHLFEQMPDYPDYYSLFKFTYDDLGRLLTAYSYYQYDGNWEINVGKNYTYDSAGNVSEIMMEENWWAYWTSFHKFTYDSKGKLICYKEEPWYDILATYSYNSEGNLMEENYQNWYQKKDRTYEYDQNGNRILKSMEYIVTDNTSQSITFLEYSSEAYSYLDQNFNDLVNLNLSLLDQSNELDEMENCPNKLISSVEYKVGKTSNAINTPGLKKSDYYYSQFKVAQSIISGIDDKLNSEISVYPNPATGRITFTGVNENGELNLKIFQLTGSCIKKRCINSNETISLEKLPKGIYIYQLSDKNQLLKAGKLVVQ